MTTKEYTMAHPEIRVDTHPPKCVCRWATICAIRGERHGTPGWWLENYDPRCQADHERPKEAS